MKSIAVLMSVLLLCAGALDVALAKPSKQKNPEEKKQTIKKSLADDSRKKILEKAFKDFNTKKDNAKKQIALEAKALQDAKKKLVLYKTKFVN